MLWLSLRQMTLFGELRNESVSHSWLSIFQDSAHESKYRKEWDFVQSAICPSWHPRKRSKLSLMRTGSLISPSSSSSRSLSLDSPESWKKGQYILPALSSLRSDGTPKTRTIAVGVQAHKKLQNEPFAYAFNNLVERICCKVVVICCLSRIQDEMGVDHPVDVEHFTGISKRKLDLAISQQINNLNHFLRSFREQLTVKGVQLEIRIATGPKSIDILVKAAKAIGPHWVVLDRSFGGKQRKIHAALECNLVLMKRGANIEVLKLSHKFLGPVEQISEEEPEVPASPTIGSRTPSTARPYARSMTFQQALQIESSIHETTTQKVFSCFKCIFSRGAPVVETDGPTSTQTVLYGDTGPGSQAQYLGKVGHQSSTSEDFSLYSGSTSSPAASVSSPIFSLTKRSVTKTTTRRRSIKILEEELVAQMQTPPEEDEPYLVQL